MSEVIIGREVLDLYDAYDGDFGLLDERWAPEKDRQKLTSEQRWLFSEYIAQLEIVKRDVYAAPLREAALRRMREIEPVMDREVAAILRERVLGKR